MASEAPVTPEDIALVRLHAKDLKSSSVQHEKSCPPYTGLVNQGATCYLNSLLQSLFFIDSFRTAVFAWRYSTDLHGPEEDCIPLQLQRLFARLALSHAAAETTQGLTQSFGWTGEEAFRQHDVQELMRVLFDALQLSDAAAPAAAAADGSGGTPAPVAFSSLLSELFEGTCADRLKCLTCGHSRVRTDRFMDLTLPVTGLNGSAGGKAGGAAPTAAAATVTTSTQTGAADAPAPAEATAAAATEAAAATPAAEPAAADSNSDIQLPLPAEAAAAAAAAPADGAALPPPHPLLTRSVSGRYSPYTSLHRALRQYLQAETLTGDNRWQCEVCGTKVDARKSLGLVTLPPILTLHLKRFSFDWNVGKYAKVSDAFTFPFEIDMAAYLEVNQISRPSTAAAAPATADPPALVEDVPVAGGGPAAARLLRARRESMPSTDDAAALVKELTGEAAPAAAAEAAAPAADVTEAPAAAPSLPAAMLRSPTPVRFHEPQMYSLSAILMHSGSAAGGHYYAFVREPNSAHATSDAATAATAATAPSWLLVNDMQVERVTQAEVAKACGAADIGDGDSEAVEGAGAGAGAGAGSNAKIPNNGTAYMLLYRTGDASTPGFRPELLPDSISAAIAEENKLHDTLLQVAAVRKRLSELTVHLPVPSATATGTASFLSLQPKTLSLLVPASSPLSAAEDEAHGALAASCAAAGVPAPAREDVRLRRFDPATLRPLDTYTAAHHAGASLSQLKLAPSATLVLEARSPGASWQEYDPEAVELRLLLWSPALEAAVASIAAAAEVKLDDGAHAFASLESSSSGAEVVSAQLHIPGNPVATVATLQQALTTGLLKDQVSSGVKLKVHCIVLPGLLPSSDDVSSGAAAGRLRIRMSDPRGKSGAAAAAASASASASASSGMRILSFTLNGGDMDTIREVTVLSQQLRRDVMVADGDDVVVIVEAAAEDGAAPAPAVEAAAAADAAAPVATAEYSAGVAAVVTLMKRLYASDSIRVQFNLLKPLPTGMSALEAPVEASAKYDLSLQAKRDESLADFKKRMVEAINAARAGEEPYAAESVHIRRGPKAAQMRDESRSLRDLDVGDGACLYIMHGAPLLSGQVVVRVWMGGAQAAAPAVAEKVRSSQSSKAPLTRLVIADTSKISALKKSLQKRLISLGIATPECTHSHLRLRVRGAATDLSTAVTVTIGGILRDDSGIRQALNAAASGVDAGADERDVVVQLLAAPETIGPGDIVIRAQELRWVLPGATAAAPPTVVDPKTPDARPSLTSAEDVVFPKTMTVRKLISTLATGAAAGAGGGGHATELAARIRIAKHSPYGPALTPGTAATTMKWIGPVTAEAAAAAPAIASAEGASAVPAPADDAAGDSVWDQYIVASPLGLKDGAILVWRRDAVEADGAAAANAASAAAAAKKGPAKPWQRPRGGANAASNSDSVVVAVPKGQRDKEVGVSIRVKAREGTSAGPSPAGDASPVVLASAAPAVPVEPAADATAAPPPAST